jgi:hypothetical protein
LLFWKSSSLMRRGANPGKRGFSDRVGLGIMVLLKDRNARLREGCSGRDSVEDGCAFRTCDDDGHRRMPQGIAARATVARVERFGGKKAGNSPVPARHRKINFLKIITPDARSVLMKNQNPRIKWLITRQ